MPAPKALGLRPAVSTTVSTTVLTEAKSRSEKSGSGPTHASLPSSNAAVTAALATGGGPAPTPPLPALPGRLPPAVQDMFGNSAVAAVAAVAAAGRGESRGENRKTAAAHPAAPTRPAPAAPAASDAAEAAPAAGADRAADKADKAGAAKGTKARPGPNADPKFAQLKKDVAHKKRTLAASHPPPRTEATAAQDAALPPKDDAEAQGKTANAEEMNEAKPKEFDKAAFIKAVEKAIADKAPKNLDEADKFADSGKAEEVRAEVTGKVGEGKSASAEQIATTTAAPPNTAVAVPKKVVPMKADRPPGAPASPNAAQAVPDKLPKSATDLSAGPAEVKRRMAGAQVTEAQLQKSNEPKFKKALSEKKNVERHSASAPDKMRGHEKKELKAATARAKRLGTDAMGAMGAQRTLTGKRVDTGKGGAKSRDEGKRAKVTKLLQGVFDTMQKDVQAILDGLDKLVGDQFDRGEKAAREAFTAEHKQKMEEYKDRRYSGWRGKARWVKDLFAGLPAEADKIFEKARDNYVQRMRQVISDVADTIGAQLNKAKRRIAQGRKEMQDAVQALPADLRSIGRQAAAEFTDKFDELTQSVDDKGTELVDTLATKYTDALKSVDDEIAAEKEKNKGLVAKAVDAVKGVINTIMELKKLLLSVLAKAATAVMLILKDPIGFLKNLVTAVGGGLKLFLKNIGRHLQQGIMSWLLGKTADAGIQLPAKFDTQGIVTMLASLLGLTWQNIRARIVRKVPKMEPAVTAAETAVPLVAEVRKRGVAGMWNDLKSRLGDMKKQLLDKVIAYVTPTIVQAGIMWILSLLNPASAFVRAVKLIIDIVRFIVTQARQIFEFVNAVLDAVIAIARGGTGGVPALIERALARSVPVLLGFLASLLGIGGVVSKVKQIVQALSKPVNRAVDWVIDKIVGLVKKLWAKIKSKFKRSKRPKPVKVRRSKQRQPRKAPRGRKPRTRPDPRKDRAQEQPQADTSKDDRVRVIDRRTSVGTESHIIRVRVAHSGVSLQMASEGFGLIRVKLNVLRQLAQQELRSGNPRRQKRGDGINKALDAVDARAQKLVSDHSRMPNSPARDRMLDDGLNDLSELISNIGVRFQIPGLEFTRPLHNPVPSPLDSFGRATAYSGNPVSRESQGKGSASSGVYIPGITIPGVGTLERGHLLADLLGGSGSIPENLSPITKVTNTAMKKPEREVADFIYTGDISNHVFWEARVEHAFPETSAANDYQAWLASTFPPTIPNAGLTIFKLVKTHLPSGAEINRAMGGPRRSTAEHERILRGLAYFLIRSQIVITIRAVPGPMNTVRKPTSPSPISNNIPPP